MYRYQNNQPTSAERKNPLDCNNNEKEKIRMEFIRVRM